MTGQQLRNSILQEAIHGRLVPNVLQPGEKTGGELLKDILDARQKKENEEKGKMAKKLILSTIEEEPCELPEGWCWCNLGDLCVTVGNKENQIKATEVKEYGKYPVVSQGQSFVDGYYDDESKIITDIPVIIFGDHTKNVKYIDFPFIVGADGTKVLSPFPQLNAKWFFYTIFYYAKVILYDRGYARHFSLLNKELFPLPPLSIQKAIVAKIEELLPLVDEYDKAAEELETLNNILPDILRKSVLQEAIHGNLVPNDIPEGEATGAELLQQILKERQDRENKEKGKKAKKLTLSAIEEEPWELPEGWCWCRGKDIFFPMESTKPKADFVYIDTDAVNNKKNIIDNPKSVLLKNAPSRATRKLHANDILFSMVRPYLKNIAYVDEQYASAIGTTGFYVITTSSSLYRPYLFKLMLSDYVVSGLTAYMKGDNSPSINNGHIEDFLYPIPPLSIQRHIVEKIEEVFAAIDNLPA